MRVSLAIAALVAGFAGLTAPAAQADCVPGPDRYPRACSQGDCYYVVLSPTGIVWLNC